MIKGVLVMSEVTTDEVSSSEKFDADYVGEPKEVDRDFVYPQQLDPRRLDDPSNKGAVYLDVKQRQDAERLRAKVEDRKPDLTDPPATCGTPLVTVEAASKNIAGDVLVHIVENETIEGAVKTLPVVVGVNEDNLRGNAAAMNERERNAVKAEEPLTAPRYTDGPNTEKQLAVGDPNVTVK